MINRIGFQVSGREVRPGALAAACVLTAVLAGAGFWVFSVDPLPRHGRAAPDVIRMPAAPVAGRNADQTLFLGEALGHRQGFRRRFHLLPPYLPQDVSGIVSGDVRILLLGIEGPGIGAVCSNEDGSLAACGLEARASAYQIYRLEALSCETPVPPDRAAQPLPVTCTIRGRDLATELVRAGVARPRGVPGRAMWLAEEEARAARRGLWAVDWQFRP